MEFDIFHLHGFAPRSPSCGFEHGFVVKTESEFRHAGQIAFQFDGAEDLAAENIPRRAHQQIERFNDIQEHLVFPIPNALTPPTDGICDGNGRSSLDLEFVAFLRDVLLEDFGFGSLRVAEIHHFVEKLVDDDEIVADGFLLQGFEVFGEDGDEAVEEEEDRGGVRVAFGEGEDVEVGVPDVEVLGLAVGEYFLGERKHGN